jgi:hypothetical protein
MEDPRAVERELRTAAGPAAVTAPASEITTGIPSRSALSVGAKNVDMERAAAQEQLASLKKVLAASRRIKNKAEHQIHRENDIMGSINELEDVLDLDRTPFTSLFESRPRAETEGLVPYTPTKPKPKIAADDWQSKYSKAYGKYADWHATGTVEHGGARVQDDLLDLVHAKARQEYTDVSEADLDDVLQEVFYDENILPIVPENWGQWKRFLDKAFKK